MRFVDSFTSRAERTSAISGAWRRGRVENSCDDGLLDEVSGSGSGSGSEARWTGIGVGGMKWSGSAGEDGGERFVVVVLDDGGFSGAWLLLVLLRRLLFLLGAGSIRTIRLLFDRRERKQQRRTREWMNAMVVRRRARTKRTWRIGETGVEVVRARSCCGKLLVFVQKNGLVLYLQVPKSPKRTQARITQKTHCTPLRGGRGRRGCLRGCL